MATTITTGNSTNGGAIISSDNTGILELKTGTGSGTTGLTINASQNTTLAGTLSAGAITSSGLVTGATGALYPIVSGTAVASTSGTSIPFTGIPSWVKQITVMFQGVSASSTGVIQIQIGSGSYTISGYLSGASNFVGYSAVTTGFGCAYNSAATSLWHGSVRLNLLNASTNTWVANGILNDSSAGARL